MRSSSRIAGRPGWLVAVALSGLPLVGCYTGELGVAQGSFDFTRVAEAEDLGEEPAQFAPAAWARAPRSLPSAGDVTGADNSGWRMGLLFLSGRTADEMLALGKIENKVLTAWGYQWQWTYGEAGSTQGLLDVVPLLMGLDESMLIPSLNVMVGLRIKGHYEFSLGPHVSPRAKAMDPWPVGDEEHIKGLGMAWAFGYADWTDSGVNWSVNISGMKAGDLASYGITAGWNFSM